MVRPCPGRPPPVKRPSTCSAPLYSRIPDAELAVTVVSYSFGTLRSTLLVGRFPPLGEPDPQTADPTRPPWRSMDSSWKKRAKVVPDGDQLTRLLLCNLHTVRAGSRRF